MEVRSEREMMWKKEKKTVKNFSLPKRSSSTRMSKISGEKRSGRERGKEKRSEQREMEMEME